VNFELTEEQKLLQEAARDALSRIPHLALARGALDGNPPSDLWPTAQRAGWAGLLVSEANGGAGLALHDAMLVMAEAGRVLASGPLAGHLIGSWLLDRANFPATAAVGAGDLRVACVPARPPSPEEPHWTGDARDGRLRPPAPTLADGRVTGEVWWVPEVVGADLFVVTTDQGRIVVVDDAEVRDLRRFDMTRPLGVVVFHEAAATELPSTDASTAWFATHALLAAESVGAATACLDMAVDYAKERVTFARPIGSYQAVKHALVEVLRLIENARSLLHYAAWAAEERPHEFALAASAARSAGGRALDEAARTNMSVHGGIGATWEHDAPLYFRHAQLSRRLLGGTTEASDRVALELLVPAT
jgi:alkylation response protein AidB-like acyl-CoA dehydrogenase